MTGEIAVRLYWLAGDTGGRFLLHRTMPQPGGSGDRHQYWRSGPVGAFAAARLDLTARSTAEWQQLLLGLPLPTVTLPATPHPIALHRLSGDALHHVRSRLGSVFDVAGVSLRFTDRDGVLELSGGRLDANRFEPAALGVAPFLRRTLDDLRLARTTDPPAPAPGIPMPGDEIRASLGSAIHLHDTRGVQIGDHNLQVNRFTVRGPRIDLSFDEVLRNPSVKTAMSALLAEPGNSDLRGNLVSTLRNVDRRLSVAAQPLTLSAQSKAPGLLDRLLAFDVQGLQVGKHSTQRNDFLYTVTDSPNVTALLGQDQNLAQQLADYLFPAAGDVGSLATLRQHVDRAVQGLGITFDRNVDQHLKAPRPGHELHVYRTDGLTIGDHNRVRSTREVNLNVHVPRPPDPADLSDFAHRATPRTRRPDIAAPGSRKRTAAPSPPGIRLPRL